MLGLPFTRLRPLAALVLGLGGLALGCVPATTSTAVSAAAGAGAPVPEPIEGVRERPDTSAAPSTALPASRNDAPVTLRYARQSTPWLGVELRATKHDAPGVEITRVLSGSPAHKARLAPGDVLLTLDDKPAHTPADVTAWVRSQKANETFPLTISRNGQTRLVRAELEGMPEFEDRLRLELVNRTAPEIAGVTTFQGDASSLRELRGRVVILEFWGSFCSVCRYLAPRLDEWHRTYKPQGASVVGITVDPPSLGRNTATRVGMSYVLASDVDARVTRAYMASQLPLLIIIDRNGIVRDAVVGYSAVRLRETELLIEALLRD